MTRPDKRQEILRAALELVAEQGFHDAPMSLIAKKAGVAAGTIYCYFENKDVLMIELFRDLEERAHSVIMGGYAAEKPIRDRFLHLGTALIWYFITNPLDFRYLEQFFNSPYGTAFRRDRILGNREARDVFRELFEDGVAKQAIKDIPLVVLFALTFGPLLAIARDHILKFIELDEHLIQLTVDACWNSVKR